MQNVFSKWYFWIFLILLVIISQYNGMTFKEFGLQLASRTPEVAIGYLAGNIILAIIFGYVIIFIIKLFNKIF